MAGAPNAQFGSGVEVGFGACGGWTGGGFGQPLRCRVQHQCLLGADQRSFVSQLYGSLEVDSGEVVAGMRGHRIVVVLVSALNTGMSPHIKRSPSGTTIKQ